MNIPETEKRDLSTLPKQSFKSKKFTIPKIENEELQVFGSEIFVLGNVKKRSKNVCDFLDTSEKIKTSDSIFLKGKFKVECFNPTI